MLTLMLVIEKNFMHIVLQFYKHCILHLDFLPLEFNILILTVNVIMLCLSIMCCYKV